MKKLLSFFTAVICVIACAFPFAACNFAFGGDGGNGDTENEQPKTVAVTSVTLNKSTLTLEIGDEETLTAEVKPDNATDKTVTWTSDKPEFATVDNTGKVTAIAEGTAIITATADGKTANCTVTVNSPAPVGPTQSLSYTLNDDNASYTVTGRGTVTSLDIVIPSEYEGLPVTAIGEMAFMQTSLQSVVIPGSVTAIGNSAFMMSSLKSVVISNGVTSIGSAAFIACRNLTSITFPDSVTTIESQAFNYCASLTSVTIGKGLTSIGFRVFLDCTSLTDVYISDLTAWCNINFQTAMGSNPMYYAKNLYLNGELVTSVKIDESITSLKQYVFQRCESLTSIIIHDGVTSIGYGAFEGNPSLAIYYQGTQEQWTEIDIGNSNTSLTSENTYFYSAEAPDGDGNYWHYDTDGVTPVKWQAES